MYVEVYFVLDFIRLYSLLRSFFKIIQKTQHIIYHI
jgi:hypothetical protein